MNDQLQAKLVEILASIQTAAKATGDFAMTQLPDVAQSYVLYGRTVTSIRLAYSAALLAIALYVLLKHGILNKGAVYQEGYSKGDWKVTRVMCSVLGAFCALLGMLMLMLAVSDAALVWLAPKVWLLQEIAHMVKA